MDFIFSIRMICCHLFVTLTILAEEHSNLFSHLKWFNQLFLEFRLWKILNGHLTRTGSDNHDKEEKIP
jgi:hypothetical protein